MIASVNVEAVALNTSVLMLNRLYMAVRVISAKRALTLLYREQVEVVAVENGAYASYDFDSWVEVSQFKQQFEPHKHDWISTVRFQLAIPRVVRLLGYDRLPKAQVKLNRRNLFARDRNRCQYCGKKFPTTELSIDHIVPRSQGGKNTWENIVCACIRCNTRKGGRTPEQAHMKLIQPAVKPRRSPVLTIKMSDSRYASWKQFLDYAYWNVELK